MNKEHGMASQETQILTEQEAHSNHLSSILDKGRSNRADTKQSCGNWKKPSRPDDLAKHRGRNLAHCVGDIKDG
jgi:hypothetical protein